MELVATLRGIVRAILVSAVCASAITVAMTIIIAFMSGGRAIVHINRYNEQYLDIVFVAIALAGAAMVLKDELGRVKQRARSSALHEKWLKEKEETK